MQYRPRLEKSRTDGVDLSYSSKAIGFVYASNILVALKKRMKNF